MDTDLGYGAVQDDSYFNAAQSQYNIGEKDNFFNINLQDDPIITLALGIALGIMIGGLIILCLLGILCFFLRHQIKSRIEKLEKYIDNLFSENEGKLQSTLGQAQQIIQKSLVNATVQAKEIVYQSVQQLGDQIEQNLDKKKEKFLSVANQAKDYVIASVQQLEEQIDQKIEDKKLKIANIANVYVNESMQQLEEEIINLENKIPQQQQTSKKQKQVQQQGGLTDLIKENVPAIKKQVQQFIIQEGQKIPEKVVNQLQDNAQQFVEQNIQPKINLASNIVQEISENPQKIVDPQIGQQIQSSIQSVSEKIQSEIKKKID